MRVARLIQTRVWSLSDWQRSKISMSRTDWTTPVHEQWARNMTALQYFKGEWSYELSERLYSLEWEQDVFLTGICLWRGMILRGHSSDIDVCYKIWSPTGSDTPLVRQSTVSRGVWRVYTRVRRRMTLVLESQLCNNTESFGRDDLRTPHGFQTYPSIPSQTSEAEFTSVEWHGRSCYDWSLNPWQATKFSCQDTSARCKYFGPQRPQSLEAAASNVNGS